MANTINERLPAMAPVQGTSAAPEMVTQPSMPAVATQPSVPPAATASAIPPMPSAPAAPALPPAFDPPPSASQATGIGSFSILPPAVQNLDRTVSRRMDQVGNNAIVTFSGDDEMASKKAKLFGASA